MRSSSPPAADPSALLRALARRIRALRERRGLTQEDFAARCGISGSFASLLERGERSPSYETLVQVAAALDVSLAELFQGEEDEAAGAWRLVTFARERQLTGAQVEQLLAVAEVLFSDSPAPPRPVASVAQQFRPGAYSEDVRGSPGTRLPSTAVHPYR